MNFKYKTRKNSKNFSCPKNSKGIFMKTINYILIILLILDIPILLYLSNFNYFVFNENFYKKEFKKYNAYDNLKNYYIEKINKDVLDYLKNKNIELTNNNFFNQREKTHLKDVKNLMQFILFAFYFSIILFFILFILLIILNKKTIIKISGMVFLFSGALTFIDAFIFWIMVKINFNFAFDLMHNAFFKAGTYIFDPSFENIVVLYPQQFFYDITASIALNTLIFSLFLFLIGLLIIFYYGKKRNYKKTKKYLKEHK